MNTMAPGIYRLTQTVANPQPGRRKSDWTQARSWAPGMVFVLKDEIIDMPEGFEDRKELRLTRPKGGSIYSLSLQDVRTQALLPHLVALEEKPSEWLHRMECGTNMAPDVIDRLVASGKITRADVETTYEQCLAALFENKE